MALPLAAKGSKLSMAGCGRRTLLRCGAAAACAPLVTQLTGCAPRIGVPTAIPLDAPVDGVATVQVSRVPELMAAGGALLLRPQGEDDLGRPLSILVVRASDSAVNTQESNPSGLYAFDAYCPHAGCEVAWDDKDTQVVCPCHLSRFAVDGTVVNPPAQSPLDTYPVKFNSSEQTISIDLGGAGGIFPPVVGNRVTFDISTIPALAAAGGSATGRSQGVTYPLLVMRTTDTQLLAFDARCPHLGCAVEGAQSFIICPCHGSVFGLDGSVEAGPATMPLKELQVTFDGTTAVVTIA